VDVIADGLERPVLVGGTGRSGSTIVGHLLDHHPDLTLTRPMEVRFITGNDGLADALAVATRKPGSPRAESAAQLAVDRLLHRWFERAPEVGLHQSMTLEDVERWSHEYLVAMPDDPISATRLLTRRIMGRIAERLEALRLVDTTPANARKADRAEPIYPDSVVVVVTRDGRDVAASFVSQSFGPDDVFEALDQWEQRMLRTQQAVAACRPGRVLTLPLMELVVTARQDSLQRLCDHVGVDVDPAMVAWFDENVTPEGAHPGRWRRDFDDATCMRIDGHYAAAVERLTAAGVTVPS
jgi:hypothetical protein